MKRFLRRSSKDFALLLLRIAAGGIMAFSHGLPKLLGFESRFHSFPDPIGMGSEVSYILTVFAEFICAVAIILGVYTRLAVVPLIVTMLIVIFVVHVDDPWGRKELATMFLAMYTSIFVAGPGKYSIDNKIIG